MPKFLFPDWENMLQVLITAPILYLLVIVGIRLVGNRSTSSMNNFDWIVTVAIGSLFASTIILEETTLWEGVFGIILLLLLQYLLTWGVKKWESWRKLLKATPQLLVFEGEFLDDNMIAERIIEGEVYAAIRANGYKSLNDIYAVVLETNAQLSVIPIDNNDQKGFSLANVGGLPDGLRKDLEQRGEEDDQPDEEA